MALAAFVTIHDAAIPLVRVCPATVLIPPQRKLLFDCYPVPPTTPSSGIVSIGEEHPALLRPMHTPWRTIDCDRKLCGDLLRALGFSRIVNELGGELRRLEGFYLL